MRCAHTPCMHACVGLLMCEAALLHTGRSRGRMGVCCGPHKLSGGSFMCVLLFAQFCPALACENSPMAVSWPAMNTAGWPGHAGHCSSSSAGCQQVCIGSSSSHTLGYCVQPSAGVCGIADRQRKVSSSAWNHLGVACSGLQWFTHVNGGVRGHA